MAVRVWGFSFGFSLWGLGWFKYRSSVEGSRFTGHTIWHRLRLPVSGCPGLRTPLKVGGLGFRDQDEPEGEVKRLQGSEVKIWSVGFMGGCVDAKCGGGGEGVGYRVTSPMRKRPPP